MGANRFRRDRQAEARAPSGFLCGKEWLEDLTLHILRNALPGVDNIDTACVDPVVVRSDCTIVLHRMDSDRQGSNLRHRVERIIHQIAKNFLQLLRIPVNDEGSSLKVIYYGDMTARDFRPE